MVENNPNKYNEAFSAFAPALSIEELDKRIEDILAKSFEKNNTREVKKFLHSTIDLTTLSGADTEETSRAQRTSPQSLQSACTPTSSRPYAVYSLPRVYRLHV